MKKTITFLIRSGNHFADNFFRMRIAFRSRINVSYMIHKTDIYSYNGAENSTIQQFVIYDYTRVINGWSKIIGLTDLFVHRNSCRLVFISNKDGLQVGYSVYQAGVRTIKAITTIQPGIFYHVMIERNKRHYIITHSNPYDKSQSTSRFFVSRRILPFQFILHPYIGGRFTLDNNVSITITRHNVP